MRRTRSIGGARDGARQSSVNEERAETSPPTRPAFLPTRAMSRPIDLDQTERRLADRETAVLIRRALAMSQ